MNATARRVNALARQLHCRRYLEIGVLHGTTFRDVEIPERTDSTRVSWRTRGLGFSSRRAMRFSSMSRCHRSTIWC